MNTDLPLSPEPWRDAVMEQLDICGLLYPGENQTDPKKALELLVGYLTECAYKDGLERSEWKGAVIDELMSWYIYRNEHENNPKKAVHDLIVLHSEVAVDLYKRDRWHRRLWDKIRDIWYSTPISYKLWKICGSKQPPF